jgi:HisJ family histidinol phosphate phosphatase
LIDLHIHSTFSDGKDFPEDMVRAAIAMGLQTVALCEHVRQTTGWFPEYIREVQRLKQKYKKIIRVYSAIEVKVVDLAGNIDTRPEFFVADIVYAAVHRVPLGKGEFCSGQEDRKTLKSNWLSCLRAAILHNDHVTALAHLFLPAIQYGLEINKSDIQNLAQLVASSEKAVEISLKYGHPAQDQFFYLLAGKVPFTIGSDSHSVQEMLERKQALEIAWKKWGRFCECRIDRAGSG